MIIGTLKEKPSWEHRVALVPQSVRQLIVAGHTVLVEKNAGASAGYEVAQYEEAGAKIMSAEEIYKQSEVIAKIWAPMPEEYKFLQAGQMIIANFESWQYPERTDCWKEHKIKAVALERLPRLSRVQDIDILSSQNNLAGYKAGLLAMNMLNQSVPLMMTSAGNLTPVKALVLGTGVAGLQAIATLGRMGAIVWASDIRPETEEQVKSLGAKFVVSNKENLEQQLAQCAILITSALAQNGKPPLLIEQDMLKKMPANSVAIDMAGGNIEGAEKGKVLDYGNVRVLTRMHLASEVANSASFLFSRNIYNLLMRRLEIEKDYEIWQHILLTKKEE